MVDLSNITVEYRFENDHDESQKRWNTILDTHAPHTLIIRDVPPWHHDTEIMLELSTRIRDLGIETIGWRVNPAAYFFKFRTSEEAMLVRLTLGG